MPSLATPMGRLLLAAVPTRYLLLARFNGAIAAPLPSPLPVDVGALTVVDTNGIMSQAGGQLVVNGTAAAGDGIATAAALTRKAGRTMVFSLPSRTTMAGTFGWSTGGLASANLDIGIDYTGGVLNVRTKTDGNVISTDTLLVGLHTFAFVMRATGGFALIRSGFTGPYTVAWVYSSVTSNLIPRARLSSTSSYTLDDFRVTDLGGAFASDYGIATNRLAGARSAGETFTHTADCLIEYTVTTVPSSGAVRVLFRVQDASNYWLAYIGSTGTLALYETVAGVDTERAGAAGVANGNRVVITAVGSVIKGYSNNVLLWTYSSASNFATATSGELDALGTGGAVSDVIAWPRQVSLPSNV